MAHLSNRAESSTMIMQLAPNRMSISKLIPQELEEVDIELIKNEFCEFFIYS